ncbi:MAG: DUF1772 domain-containing protein [Gemmatimonadales bacterium]
MALELIATVCAGLFAGAAIYINLVEHPARLECGTAAALAQWRPSYRRATIMQASLAVVGSVSAVVAWIRGGSPMILAGGLLLGTVVPFTLLVIFPTNRRLLDPSLDPGSADAAMLLRRWGQLHAGRSVAGAAAFAVLVLCVVRSA